ncbi:MAG: co-chaperone GroES [Bacillota bacterium]|nr:co-chaperone GroES [Bacillota bacterium]
MLEPLHDYVLLKKEKEEKMTTSGIVLTSIKEPSKLATVIKIGKEVISPEYTIGDKVLFKERDGIRMKSGDEEYIVVPDKDIIAVDK